MPWLDSWTLPGNGILGGVTLNLGPSRSDDPNSEPENLLAKALREATERQRPGEAEHLGTVVEQIRRNSIPSAMVNPLAFPAADLIDWFRRPPEPPQMPQRRTIGSAPYYALDFDAQNPNARIGRAIINHYAEYFDPYIKDEQGRRVIDTPAAYTPNAAGKLPQRYKPEWWPLVGIADMASNFIPVGAGVKAMTVGGRGAFAASKAAVAEAGQTGKLLNAIREGQLAKLAGEGTVGDGVPSNAAPAIGEINGYHLVGGADASIFRGGNQTLNNLIPRPVDNEVLSFRDSLSNPYPLPPGQRPVLAPGKKYMEFDSSKFPPGSVVFDHAPPGHVGVRGVSPEQLMDSVIKTGKFPR